MSIVDNLIISVLLFIIYLSAEKPNPSTPSSITSSMNLQRQLQISTTCPTFPINASSMVAGFNYVNRKITIIAGNTADGTVPLILFDITKWNSSDAFSYKRYDLGVSCFDIFTQGYSQIEDTLYIYDGAGSFRSFNVLSYAFNENTQIAAPIDPGYLYPCSTHIDNYLIVSGGLDVMAANSIYKYVQIYNTLSGQWIPNVPNMNEARLTHSCVVSNGYLYNIGGSTENGICDSVEKMYVGDMENIANYNSMTINDKLSSKKSLSRSAVYHEFIYVIGGSNYNNFFKEIDMINTMDDVITLFGELLVGMDLVTSIIVDSHLYVFGGRIANSRLYGYGMQSVDYVQYFDLNKGSMDCTGKTTTDSPFIGTKTTGTVKTTVATPLPIHQATYNTGSKNTKKSNTSMIIILLSVICVVVFLFGLCGSYIFYVKYKNNNNINDRDYVHNIMQIEGEGEINSGEQCYDEIEGAIVPQINDL